MKILLRKVSESYSFSIDNILSWLSLIATFLLGQGFLQLIQVASGLLLLRWLSIDEYAQYSMAFAFQCTAHILVEFGISGSIIALSGGRIHDKKVVGGYIKAGMAYRRRLFFLISTACLITFPLVTAKHDWPPLVTIMLLISIVTSLYFSGWTSYYTPPLRMHQQIGLLYKIQIRNGLLRVFILYVVYIVSILNSWLAALLGSLQTLMNGYFIKGAAVKYVDETDAINECAKKEMVDFIKPLVPAILFSAFQGQIMVFLSAIFGDANNIAEIGALSRVGQLFAVFSMAGGVLIAPYLARLSHHVLLKRYFSIVGLIVILCLFMVVGAYLFPQPLLWMLGSNYSHLATEVNLVVISSSIALIAGVIWEMNESRRWIYRWDSILMIIGTVGIQVFCMINYDLSSVRDIIFITILSNMFLLLLRISATIYSFRRLR